MGFVGGGGNIAIATALPPSSFEYCIVNIKKCMEFIYLIFYACLRLRFLEVETNPGPQRPVPDVCRILWSNVQGLAGTLVTWPWLRLSMIYCFALRLWSQICVTLSEIYVWCRAGYIRKSLVIFGYLWNAIRAGIFSVGYSRVSLTIYDNI